jgi:adenosylmethionine---8-amino-7-oxononanoate aminotransferase
VREFRHQGMIWAFDVATDNPAFARDFYVQALKRELLLRPIGKTVYFMPPYTIEEDQWRMLVERTAECIDQAA